MIRTALLRACLLTATVMLGACGPLADAEEFRNASPSRQGLKISAPTSGSKALESGDVGSQKQGLGQTAEMYKLTVGVTTVVNGGMAWVLNLCEEIVKHEPTTISENEAVWGPHTEALSPDTFRFTVTRKGDAFEYVLHTRPKASTEESDFVAILSGTHTPGLKQRQGKGSFKLDWDAAQAMGRKPREIGSATFDYERDENDDVRIDAKFQKVRDEETGSRIDADYGFTQAAGGGAGTFDFVFQKDIHNRGGPAERLAIRSRWNGEGAGRADVRISGGDLTGSVDATECWSTAFVRTYWNDSLGIVATEGEEASCAFAAAEYSSL